MSYHIGLQVLRAKVRGFQAAGESLHRRIRKSSGPKRNALWNEKRRLGSYNREHLIAYGLLRGIPYERIERCADDNKPNAEKVFELMKAHGDWKVARELTLEKVKESLVPSQTQPAASQTESPLPTSPTPAEKPKSLLGRARALLEKGA
jgi:hypothetical protein